ncbi:PEP-CTERM protein-sorting domain-containing protein [Rubritalea squalenifaciens DSM 18772]|uniref:PEP-CTERM protein-sorting domain-containing protein n=1 Tax=Rubritalea squalenifaciens DSM 18772 TaxID=1123071 RepID=A0A1M6B2K4_9BACT|nr:LamG-like jellyroll fold domain-containing protein [Rubritalea squalenifaciens]SHI42974.1 PEP-CTERM protein-sorting domain-containing protein [Rubritalea squalenifaciens DSM 18772]
MLKTITLMSALALVPCANAALIAHYTFDSDGTDSGTSGGEAILGDSGSINNSGAAVGGGYLDLAGSPLTDTAGGDGAVSTNTFDWSSSDVRTLSFWVMAAEGDTGDTNATLISLGSGAGGGTRFDVRLDGENLRLEVQSGGSTTASDIVDGSWHHVAIVVNNSTSTVNDVDYYIDGSFVGSFANAQSINTGTGPLRMGDSYQDTGRDFKGGLDDVRLYDEALTSGQIAALAAVPEPSSTALIGLTGLGFLLRRRR